MGWNKGRGKAYAWVLAHADFQDDNCLQWPFSLTRGYGALSHMGRRGYAHRFMCELIHGEPPTAQHEAAHSCGRGDLGCVNPKHISWKTKSGNLLDCREHGTQARTYDGTRGRITQGQADQIRAMKGIKLQREIAGEFGISESTVSDIWLGRTHTRPPKIRTYTQEEDEKIREAIRRGYNFRQMAYFVGRPYKGVSMRAYRLGLKSGCPAAPNSR